MHDPEAHLAEPVRFELLRSARSDETREPEAQFATLPMLPTPADLWQRAIKLGQACRQIGRTVFILDLLVAAVALHHNAALVSCVCSVWSGLSDPRPYPFPQPSSAAPPRQSPPSSSAACW